jgi:endonuclease-3 related protein
MPEARHRDLEEMPPLRQAYELMRARFGHLAWWPGESAFEVCVGAILTQNTNWGNVERAIANLKRANLLAPGPLHALPEPELAELIRPAGCPSVKARRLRAFLHVLVTGHDGRLERLFAGETAAARQRLLAIKGIGPETADCMLLYAGSHRSFVVDAYTKRIFSRHGWCRPTATYGEIQNLCVKTLEPPAASSEPPTSPPPAQLDYWQDYHAQLVMTGKTFCRATEPRCGECPLKPLLPAA